MGNYMYIVECSDNSLYTGWTNDLEKRMKAHNTGQGAKYTKNRRPVRLCYWENFETKREAMSREAKVKRLTREQKMWLIKNEDGLSGGFAKDAAKSSTEGEGFEKSITYRAMRIRPVSSRDDRMSISRVYEESWKQAYQNIVPQDYLDSIPAGAWCETAFLPGMYSLVVTAGDEIVGTASFCKQRLFNILPEISEKCGEIVSVYFIPQYMGKGFGTLLMQAVLAELEKTGYQSCCLWVLEENKRARHFYEKMGFVPDGAYMEQEIGEKPLREMRYVLELG